ncbi:Gfo/Idh/MocA family oxidoreductase [Phragmitibacter flavus]|uniref:Gfo/Idh/MocA family oxidoreductase n=1 Tax=Phragmitibacter flavus TaxID=2576071 RepID=A0A5R8KAV1_9BACT|nr:Gfo/Idh/MocA family oxidoreductase [Phragmitibacter flavus]TLD69443.1 Gfo/Idh/MocA family oxidoreductase [Phragmitibacter flavus]
MPSRRHFLKSTFPLILGSSTLGRAGATAPNSRINLACIGLGGQGISNLGNFLADERVQITTLCDVDAKHRERAMAKTGLTPADCFTNYGEALARPGIDAVMNATPDHWHAHIAIAAAQAGKDLYSEKPLGASITEGRAICNAVQKHQRILQCGTWRRSNMKVRMACEFVRNGYIGELKEIQLGVPGTFAIRGGFTGQEKSEPIPAHFDYAQWLGSAPDRPYTAARCHFNFRWINDYSPGYITDWGAHFADVGQWGAGMDHTSPTHVHATKVTRRNSSLYDAPEQYHIELQYHGGPRITLFTTDDKATYGTKFIGTEGWIFTENETLKASNLDILRTKLKDTDTQLLVSKHHFRNFIDAVQTRGPVAANSESAQRAATICHLASLSAQLNRPLTYNPQTETFDSDPEANTFLTRPMRDGDQWKLPA